MHIVHNARTPASGIGPSPGSCRRAGTPWWHQFAPARIKAEPADFWVSVETHKEEGLVAEATSSFEPDRLDAIAPLLKTLSVVGLNLSGKYVADLEPSCRGVGGN
jgi:hypothetical protein